jgi:hypothetical protein
MLLATRKFIEGKILTCVCTHLPPIKRIFVNLFVTHFSLSLLPPFSHTLEFPRIVHHSHSRTSINFSSLLHHSHTLIHIPTAFMHGMKDTTLAV